MAWGTWGCEKKKKKSDHQKRTGLFLKITRPDEIEGKCKTLVLVCFGNSVRRSWLQKGYTKQKGPLMIFLSPVERN